MKVPILLPNIFNHPFTYESNLNLKVGDYVIVPFGKSKITGVVWDEFERKKIDDQRSQDRKSKIGTGDRSERIRTYNFPQGRVTDHRINLTLHKLEEFMQGEIFDEVIENLSLQAQEQQLENLN